MLYTLTTEGQVPITLPAAKEYLKVESSADNSLIRLMLNTVTRYAENSGRDLRANTWTLLLDSLEARICLQRSPIAAITSVKYTLAGVLTTIASSVWYLKKGLQWSELLLQDEQDWPTDGDNLETTNEHTIEIVFTTGAASQLQAAKLGMMKHLAHLYQNRGDCSAAEAAEKSGAQSIYDDLLRIERI